jgi:elongation factor Ts
MQLAEAIVTTENGYVYNHPGNNVLAIVFFDGSDSDVAKEIALQVAAMNPVYLDFDAVPDDTISELEVKFREELKESGKPENMIEQILK